MKKLKLILLILVVSTLTVKAQVPQMVNFSGVARSGNGVPLNSKPIRVQITLYDSGSSVTKLYQEYTVVKTNKSGVFSVKFGDPNNYITKGLTAFDKIDWSTNNKVVSVDFDSTGLSGTFLPAGRFQLISIPYAFVAQKAMTSAEMTSSGAKQGDELLFNATNSRFEPGISLPYGSIIAWGGDYSTVPAGWLLCDGSSLKGTDYPDLYAAIATTWGNSTSKAGYFNLPDFRGMFLRGVDGGSGRDLDSASRTSLFKGGNSGGNVGTYQNDTLKSHSHAYNLYTYNTSNTGSNAPQGSDNSGKVANNLYNSGGYGGNETRPKNAYVYYIIRAKRQ